MTKRIRLVGLPGSGKTTRLIHEIKNFVQNDNYSLNDIIFCSHSNASVNEARRRVHGLFGTNNLKFTTMHSLAKKLLAQQSRKTYIKIIDITVDFTLIENGIENPVIEFLRTVERKYNRRKRIDDISTYEDKLNDEFSTYCNIKNLQLDSSSIAMISNIITYQMIIPSNTSKLTYFDSSDPRVGGVFNDLKHDLLVGLYNLIQIIETAWAVQVKYDNKDEVENIMQSVLKKSSNVNYRELTNLLFTIQELLEIYRDGAYSFNKVLFETMEKELVPNGKILIIDEYQDIGKLQYDLAELWASSSMDIFMVAGDPNQSIYGFNGVSPSFLEDFKYDYEITLLGSYRVPNTIVNYAKQIYQNHWTEQMTSISEISGKCLQFDIEKTVEYLFNNPDKKSFILCRSDDIKQLIQVQFANFGILPRGKELSFEIRQLLSLRDIYFQLKSDLSGTKSDKNSLHDFLSSVDKFEKLFNLQISEEFNRGAISSWLAAEDKTELTPELIAEFNLLNNTKNRTQNDDLPKSEEERLIISQILPYQRKRIKRMISSLIKKVDNKQAGLQELDKLLKDLRKYNYKLDTDIMILFELDKIDKWKYGIRYRNFTNKLRHMHLERFGISGVLQLIENVMERENRKDQDLEKPLLSELEYIALENHQKNFSLLHDREKIIFENTEGIAQSLTKLLQIQQNISFLTMHAAKGREADIVIIPSMKTYYEEKKLTDPEESKRVYFVAVTRSKSELIIIEDKRFPKEPTQYLPEIKN